MATSDSESVFLDALQAALAGEHAAVWASGRAAGELSGGRRTQALKELDVHRRERDDLSQQASALGSQPVDAAAAYIEPFPVDSPRAGRRLMADVNEALAATYADVAAASPPAARRSAVARSAAAAVRAIEWGAEPEAFPGAPSSRWRPWDGGRPALRGGPAMCDYSASPAPSRASATRREIARKYFFR